MKWIFCIFLNFSIAAIKWLSPENSMLHLCKVARATVLPKVFERDMPSCWIHPVSYQALYHFQNFFSVMSSECLFYMLNCIIILAWNLSARGLSCGMVSFKSCVQSSHVVSVSWIISGIVSSFWPLHTIGHFLPSCKC